MSNSSDTRASFLVCFLGNYQIQNEFVVLGIGDGKRKEKHIMRKVLKLTNQLFIATIIIAIHAMLLTSCNTSHRTASTPQSQSSQEMYSDYFDQADKYFEKGRWRKAEKTYKKAAEYKQTFAVNYNIGVSAYNRGHYSDAIKYFNKSLNYNHSQNQDDKTKNLIAKSRKYLQQKKERIAAAAGVALVGTSAALLGASGAVGVPNSDPQYQAWINYRNSGLPGASTISFEDFKRANARAAANGYQIGGNSNSTSNSSSNSSNQKTHKCGLCGGSGRVSETKGVPSFGNTKYCSECGKTVPGNHYHTTCPSCKGKGWW